MVLALPKFVALKSCLSGRYASYKTEPYVRCEEQDVFSRYAKIEIEPAKIDSEYVHLRFCHNNRYWARSGESDEWIVASSKLTEEDTSKWSCTMFAPTKDNEGVLYLNHVQSKGRVATLSSGTSRVYLDFVNNNDSNPKYAFTYVDWDTLVIMPQYVAFKGDNDMYLKASWLENHYYLQFASNDANDERSTFEVAMDSNGKLRIKSLHWNKFWRRSPNWIWADSTDTVGNDIDTLFWPFKVDDSTIALRNAGNNNFCKRLTTEGKTNCLNAAVSNITIEAQLKVQELVLGSSVYNVNYHMDDARIFDETPVIVASSIATNKTDTAGTQTLSFSYADERSNSFQYDLSITAGVSTKITTGLAWIVEGQIEISAEVTNTFEWNTTTTVSKTVQASYQADVPPMSTIRVNCIATKGTCNIPFSYTRRDQSSTDGAFVTSQHSDGIYTGINYYNFHFEQVAVESI